MMSRLSQFLNVLVIGNPASGAPTAKLNGCTINGTTGLVTSWTAGTDLVLSQSGSGQYPGGTFPAPDSEGQIKAAKVWGAVWNDYADFQLLNDRLEYGRCYYDNIEGAKICNQRCQMGVIGVASDTFGSSVGHQRNPGREVPIAVSGWALAFVDKSYATGTPLTNDEHGQLTEMTMEEKMRFPERLIATYKKPEYDTHFGTTNHKILVNGRHWVKVR
jgi:hypothetical protein